MRIASRPETVAGRRPSRSGPGERPSPRPSDPRGPRSRASLPGGESRVQFTQKDSHASTRAGSRPPVRSGEGSFATLQPQRAEKTSRSLVPRSTPECGFPTGILARTVMFDDLRNSSDSAGHGRPSGRCGLQVGRASIR